MSKVIKTVPIEMDKTRHLKFDLNAFAEFEEAAGASLFEINLDQISIKQARALIWAGLLHEDPGLTLQHVGAHLQLSDLPTLSGLVRQALNNSLPESTGGDAQSGEPFPVDEGVGDGPG